MKTSPSEVLAQSSTPWIPAAGPAGLHTGQAVRISTRSPKSGRWQHQAGRVEKVLPRFIVVRMRGGYRECFDFHALGSGGVRIWVGEGDSEGEIGNA